jgi:hypothetical protein
MMFIEIFVCAKCGAWQEWLGIAFLWASVIAALIICYNITREEGVIPALLIGAILLPISYVVGLWIAMLVILMTGWI